jgi:hypothetical protein
MRIALSVVVCLLFPSFAFAQSGPCGTLSPAAQALLPWALSAEPGTPPSLYTDGDVRSWPQAQKSVMTYRILSPSLAAYARDSMRFWAYLASCGSNIVTAVEVPAGDATAMHTWRLGTSVTFPCPTPFTVPLTNGAAMRWTTRNCDRVTYVKWEYVFTSASRFLSLHEFGHNFVLKHKATGVFAKKQTCNWSNNVTPEQNAQNPCWLTPAELEVIRYIHWSDPRRAS